MARKSLRVTEPRGLQRSTYHLHLPLRYSVPLVAVSATLHWIISQSIFLARIITYQNGVASAAESVSEVGYSCPPILTGILIGAALVVFAVAMGYRRLNSDMPVAGSCSAAIAAACHRPKDDVDAAYLAVQWGEVPTEGTDDVGHCCLTSKHVEKVTSGRAYAGASDT